MAKAPAARQLGDDYQARLFWYHACRLFFPHHDVATVGFEADEPLGFDDVFVTYGVPQPDGWGDFVTRDYFQSKFHVAQTGAFRYTSLIDPDFIGAKASIFQRLQRARETAREHGLRGRYTLISPWPVHPDDPLAVLREFTNDGLRVRHLAEGKTVASAMGTVRIAWRDHLGLTTDEELFDLLSTFRLAAGSWSFDGLRDALNDRLYLAGFRPLRDQQISFQYDDLVKKAFYDGVHEFDRDSLEAMAQREGLWVGPPAPADDRPKVIAVRSFTKWTQQIADAADAFLDLAPHFAGRQIVDDARWTSEVWRQLSEFLETAVDEGVPACDLHLEAHTTIAFAAGSALAKAPTAITPIQRTGPSASIRWSPNGETEPPGEDLWTFNEEKVPDGDPAHLALAISVTHDVSDDVAAYLTTGSPAAGRVLHATPSAGAGKTAIRDGVHAWKLAESLAQRLRQERPRRAPGSPLHVFAAAPNAFTFFLGQHARVLGACQLYEYDFDTAELGAYRPSLLLGSAPAAAPLVHKESQSS